VKYVVDIIGILAAPVAGLLGVWVGGVIQANKDDQRLDREERIGSEARLFDHKREAYASFLSTYNHMYTYLYEMKYVRSGEWIGTDYDTFDGVMDKWYFVETYGSEDAAEKGLELVRVLAAWADASPVKHDELHKAIEPVRVAFMKALRADLGISRPDLSAS
jgi:hypothetical protein